MTSNRLLLVGSNKFYGSDGSRKESGLDKHYQLKLLVRKTALVLDAPIVDKLYFLKSDAKRPIDTLKKLLSEGSKNSVMKRTEIQRGAPKDQSSPRRTESK